MKVINGIVIKGNQKGREMGLPTANIFISKDVFVNESLEMGVFNIKAKVTNGVFDGLMSISPIKSGGFLAEIHLHNFQNDLYNYEIKVALYNKIRDYKIFKSKKSLLDSITNDVEKSKDYFNNILKTCSSCKFCYQQDEGYSNWTVLDSTIGCLLNKFSEIDSYNFKYDFDFIINDIGRTCNSFKKGEMWIFDVEGENPKPSEEDIKMWKRSNIIDNIIKE